MKGATTPPAGPTLQLLAVEPTSGLYVYQTVRYSDGSWKTQWVGVGERSADKYTAASCAWDGTGLDLVAVGPTRDEQTQGRLWYSQQQTNGDWYKDSDPIQKRETNDPGAFDTVACAAAATTLHVVGLVAGKPWHTLRASDGTWQNYLGDVSGVAKYPGSLAAVSCAGLSDGSLWVFGVSGGNVWYAVRASAGNWVTTWTQLTLENDPGDFTAIASAYDPNQQFIHLVGLVGGKAWHTVLAASSSVVGQKNWGDVSTQESNAPGQMSAVACAIVGSDLQVSVIATDKPWHTIRFAAGNWQKSWGDVTSVVSGQPGPFGGIALAGVPSVWPTSWPPS